jgi:uncharacterized protein
MRISLAPSRRRPSHAAPGRRRPREVFGAVVALTVAEALVAFVGPVTGAIVHAALLLVLLTAWVSDGDRTLLVLALVPMGRVTSLALTLDSDAASARALAGLPLLLAVGWLVRDLPAARRGDRRPPSWQGVAVALSGIPLGLAVYLLLDLPPVGGSVVVAAPVLFVFGGVLEELLFRGLVQPSVSGWWSGIAGVVLADVLFAAAYLPTRNGELVLVMASLGLGAGLYVRRTGSLVPVAVAHGLLAAGALAVWPAWT